MKFAIAKVRHKKCAVSSLLNVDTMIQKKHNEQKSDQGPAIVQKAQFLGVFRFVWVHCQMLSKSDGIAAHQVDHQQAHRLH